MRVFWGVRLGRVKFWVSGRNKAASMISAKFRGYALAYAYSREPQRIIRLLI